MTKKKDKYAHLPTCTCCLTHIATGYGVEVVGRWYHFRCLNLAKLPKDEYADGGGI